jgi:hypothetical protein
MRETLNLGPGPGQLPDIDRDSAFGDLLGMMIQGLTPTEAAAAVASNAKTLSNAASMVYDVVATAGTFTGRLELLIGDANVLPESGQVVWDGPGGSSMRFAAADAITAANFLYARSDEVNVLTSLMERNLGQRDE